MFGNRHQVSVDVRPRGYGRYGYSYRCTCGAVGWESSTHHAAQQAGQKHVQSASRKG